ncbi:MAG TPA: hypothetical protein VGF50_09075 [Caulobacteraceae bacterium]|jgi:hypothetical protein
MRHVARPSGSRAGLRGGASLAVLAIALTALAACNKPTAGQVTVAPPADALTPIAMSAPLVDAPTPQALPAAPRARLARVASRPQGYAFADRAYAMSDAFADAPPDYAYDYGGVRPWVWRAYDGAECIAEAVPGGERVYYYEPGADEPFFVEDPEYGYGFEDGALVSVYDSYGEALPYAYEQAQSEWAGRYLARAQGLYAASRQARRQAVAEQNWQAQRGYLDAQRQAWTRQLAQNTAWQAYHQQYYPAVQAHYGAERQQRLAWAARVDQMNHDQARAQPVRVGAQTARQPLATQQGFATQQRAQARHQMLAQQLATARQQTFAAQRQAQAARAAEQRGAQQQAILGRRQAARFAAQRTAQQQAMHLAAQRTAQQQAMARQAARADVEAGRRAQLMARQQASRAAAAERQAALRQQTARFAAQRGAQQRAALVRGEAQRRAQMAAQQQSRAMAGRQQAAAQQQAVRMAAMRSVRQQAAIRQAAARPDGQRRAQAAARQQVATRAVAQQRQAAAQAQVRAQAARAAQQRSTQAAARAHARQAAAEPRRPPKKG